MTAAIDEAIALINSVIGPPDPAAEQQRIERLHLARLGIMPAEMSPSVRTKGCPKNGCAGTMYETIDTDRDGRPTGKGPFVCKRCGHVA